MQFKQYCQLGKMLVVWVSCISDMNMKSDINFMCMEESKWDSFLFYETWFFFVFRYSMIHIIIILNNLLLSNSLISFQAFLLWSRHVFNCQLADWLAIVYSCIIAVIVNYCLLLKIVLNTRSKAWGTFHCYPQLLSLLSDKRKEGDSSTLCAVIASACYS